MLTRIATGQEPRSPSRDEPVTTDTALRRGRRQWSMHNHHSKEYIRRVGSRPALQHPRRRRRAIGRVQNDPGPLVPLQQADHVCVHRAVPLERERFNLQISGRVRRPLTRRPRPAAAAPRSAS